MKELSKSSFLFDLCEEFEVFKSTTELNIFSDESLEQFSDKYRQLSVVRDNSLHNYLISTPNLFRTHLPHSKWVISLATTLVWYYDEIIINDPVLQIINSETLNVEQKKHYIQERLTLLKQCEDSLKEGYLLFAGDAIFPNNTPAFEDDSRLLIEVPQVLETFEEMSMMLKKPSPINENPEDNLTQFEVLYEGLWGELRSMGMHIPPHVFNTNKLTGGVFFDFTTSYRRTTRTDLIAHGKSELLESLKKEYCKDINIVLEAIANAQTFNMPVLFYRDSDGLIAQNYSMQSKKIIADTKVYDCLLPYVQNIPPERLLEVRNEIPLAFKDFRAFLYELVGETMKSANNAAEFKHKIDSEINILMRKLNVEMEAAKRKWKFQGVAAPLAVLSGSLCLFSSGIDYSKLVSSILSSGAITQGLMTWSNKEADISKASLNPVYFLWKTQQ